MNTVEIANAVGKDERTIRRWIKKLTDKMPVLADKMSVSTPMKPADYDLDETLAIIECGMGKNAAYMFRSNVSNNPPATNSLNTIASELKVQNENIMKMLNVIMDIQKSDHARINAIESKHDVLSIDDEVHYYTIMGYAKLCGADLDTSTSIAMSSKAKQLSKERNIEIRKVPDSRFGKLNAYHETVLHDVFQM